MSLSDDYSYKIRGLDSRIDDLETEYESLKRRFGYIDDLEYELRKIHSDVTDADDKADEVRSSLEDLEGDVRRHISETNRALKKLTARIQLIEANLADADKMPRADLDTFPDSWHALGALAGPAREARAMLLSAYERNAHSASIRSYQEAVEQRDEQYAAVLAAAKTLATTAFGTHHHEAASRAFSTARRLADEYARTATHRAGYARQAQTALAQDRETRARDADLLSEGLQAQKKLHWKVRTRISEAIRDRALLPMWFVTVLGPTAPARKTEEWLEAATAVLAYRVTYRVTDQVLALGEEPDDDAPGRDLWRQELSETLRRW
ncbi:hypothetical protein ACIPJS_38060 [Streptomyces sp. NPDC086783]|uniref:hypothetical protein n=1 Tax=Streptomyces sp. NPDC086783 TaxID=3365758 RepID=UPI003819E3E4